MPALSTNHVCCEQMDNEAFVGDEKNKSHSASVELQEVQVPASNATPISTINNSTIREQCCKADLCKKMHLEYLDRARQESQSPTDRIKTLFFVVTLGLFFIWLILYTTMSKFDLI